jgi:hypothetical protein
VIALPSMMLISLEYASAHLRRDTSADDLDLIAKIKAASRAVVNYMQDGAGIFLDSSGETYIDSNGIVLDVPDDVQIATVLLVAEFYDGTPGAAVDPQYGYGYLSVPVTALLYPYRTPSVA